MFGPGVRPPGWFARGLCDEDPVKILDTRFSGQPGVRRRLQDGDPDVGYAGPAVFVTLVLAVVTFVLALVPIVFTLVAEFVRRQPRLVAAFAVRRAGDPGTDAGEPVPGAGTAAKRVVGRQHFQPVEPVGRAEPVQRATERWQPIAGVLRREYRQRTAPIGWQSLVRRAGWHSVFGPAGVPVIRRAGWCSIFRSAGVPVIGRARWCFDLGSAGVPVLGRVRIGSAKRWHSFYVVGRAARRLILGWAAVGRHPVRGRRALGRSSVRWLRTLDRRWYVRRIHAFIRGWYVRRVYAVERGWRVRRIRASSRRWRLGWSDCDRRARDSRCGRSSGRGASRLAWSAGDRCTGHSRCAGFPGTEWWPGCAWGRRFAVRPGLAPDRARTRVAGNVAARRRFAHRRRQWGAGWRTATKWYIGRRGGGLPGRFGRRWARRRTDDQRGQARPDRPALR